MLVESRRTNACVISCMNAPSLLTLAVQATGLKYKEAKLVWTAIASTAEGLRAALDVLLKSYDAVIKK